MSHRRYTIVTAESDPVAPNSMRWSACFNDFDLDVKQGWGPTEEDAVIDLIQMHGVPKT